MTTLEKVLDNFAKYWPVILFGNTEDEVRKTYDQLHPHRKRLMTLANRSVNRQRAAEMAFLASLAYQLPNNSSNNQVEALLNAGHVPLTRPYKLLTTFAINQLFVDLEDETGQELAKDLAPRGFLAESSDELIISIKGSSDVLDWLMNFNFITLENEIAHGGFLLLGTWIAEQVLAKLQPTLLRHKKRLILTGHSLGGAAALCASWKFAVIWSNQARLRLPIEVYTFGAPDVWALNTTKKALMGDTRIYSFATVGDMVADYPAIRFQDLLLLAMDGSLYKLDGSVEARAIRVFEYIQLIHSREAGGDPLIRRVMAQIRDLLDDPSPVDESFFQFFTPRYFPRRYFVEEHNIQRYLLLLQDR